MYHILSRFCSPKDIKSLPDRLANLIEFVFNRMAVDYGSKMVREVLCMLHCSRSGLIESELLELLKVRLYQASICLFSTYQMIITINIVHQQLLIMN